MLNNNIVDYFRTWWYCGLLCIPHARMKLWKFLNKSKESRCSVDIHMLIIISDFYESFRISLLECFIDILIRKIFAQMNLELIS